MNNAHTDLMRRRKMFHRTTAVNTFAGTLLLSSTVKTTKQQTLQAKVECQDPKEPSLALPISLT